MTPKSCPRIPLSPTRMRVGISDRISADGPLPEVQICRLYLATVAGTHGM